MLLDVDEVLFSWCPCPILWQRDWTQCCSMASSYLACQKLVYWMMEEQARPTEPLHKHSLLFFKKYIYNSYPLSNLQLVDIPLLSTSSHLLLLLGDWSDCPWAGSQTAAASQILSVSLVNSITLLLLSSVIIKIQSQISMVTHISCVTKIIPFLVVDSTVNSRESSSQPTFF